MNTNPVSPEIAYGVIKDIKQGKSCGSDGLSGEHFKYADKSIAVLVSMVINTCISHGYLPTKLMDTLIVPLVKNKSGNIHDKNNYRPIALVTAFSKILESVLLDMLSEFLKTSDNQFGFKRGHSTDLAIYALKSTVEL